ncbi:hypothetical protein Emag_000906 [Eimeria magna]
MAPLPPSPSYGLSSPERKKALSTFSHSHPTPLRLEPADSPHLHAVGFAHQLDLRSPSHVTLFLFFLLLILLGLALDYRRDLVQLSPGFAAAAALPLQQWLVVHQQRLRSMPCDAKDEPPVPMEVGSGPGIDLPGTQRRGERERPPAEAEAAEPFLIFPEGKEQPGGIRRGEFREESDSDEDSDVDSIEQDEDFALKWIDTTRVLTAASLATTVDEASSLMSPYISPSLAVRRKGFVGLLSLKSKQLTINYTERLQEEEDLLPPASRSRAELNTKGLLALRARDQRRPYV